MGQQVIKNSKLLFFKKGVAKASSNRAFKQELFLIEPEAKWSNYDQVEIILINNGGPNSCM
jgi:hypothetical protein